MPADRSPFAFHTDIQMRYGIWPWRTAERLSACIREEMRAPVASNRSKKSNRALASHEPSLCAEGVLRSADGAVSLLVERLLPWPQEAGVADSLPLLSHDYH
ncbi:MAG TPA: hypothetical protein VNF75_03615 [Candidatus Dormibacteraeota bacterium]|nr:hypothetical protein [Candidatus Dormibacteraeota bacterium]